jgi:hypothetical protein
MLQKPACDATHHPCCSVQLIHNKGLGVVANRDINAGEVIIAESPLLAISLSGTASGLCLCAGCVRPIRPITAVTATDISTPLTFACPNGCEFVCCCQQCFDLFYDAHVCSVTNDSIRMLQSHALFRKSPRFRLYCKAVTLASSLYKNSIQQGDEFIRIINDFMSHPLEATIEITNEFNRQSSPGLELLCEAINLSETSPPLLRWLATSEGYQRFWSVCAANAQELLYDYPISACIEPNPGLKCDPLSTDCDKDTVAGAEVASEVGGVAVMRIQQKGMGLFKTLRRLNHSCNRNAEIKLQLSDIDNNSPSPGRNDNDGTGPGVFGAVAFRDIKRGEEICISYLLLSVGEDVMTTPPAAPALSAGLNNNKNSNDRNHTSCRGKELLERYGFECDCC